MNAKQVLEQLRQGNWVYPLCESQFPFIRKMKTPPVFRLYSEVTVRIYTGEFTKFGKPKPQRRRFDAISLVKPHYKAWGDELMTVGFEVKVSKSDLMNDTKCVNYLNWTNYLFWAVSSELVSLCQERDLPFFGIYDATKDEIIKIPELQEVNDGSNAKLYREIAFKSI